MNKKQVDILLRRQALLDKITQQRQQLADFEQRCQLPANILDHTIAAYQQIKQRPFLFAGSVTAVIVYRKGVVGLARTSWKLWKLYRHYQKLQQHPAFKMALRYFNHKRRH